MPEQDAPKEQKGYVSEAYRLFLCNVRRIVEKRVADLPEQPKSIAAGMAESLFSLLGSPEALAEVGRALSEFGNPSREGKAVHDLLIQEMKLFNAMHGEDSNSDTGKALGDAATVKDSIEQILDLPDWIKKALKILNELLSLV